MHKTMWKQCRLINLSSTEFHTLVSEGWPYEELGAAIVEYEPWLAKALFEARHENRAISPSDQEKLATALGLDRWRINGQSIILSNLMRVINGQNRLHACMKTEKPLLSVTVWGVPFANAETMDIGKKHSGADILAQHQVPDAGAVAAALRTYYKVEKRALANTSVVLPDYAIVDYREQHKRIHYSVKYGNEVRRFIPPSLGTALHYAFEQKVRDLQDSSQTILADVMFSQLALGKELTERDPVYVLRELLSIRRAKDPRIKKSLDDKEYAQLGAQVINAWNALRRKRTITRNGLVWNEKTTFPEIL